VKAHWGAPYRESWSRWDWPLEMTFGEMWTPLNLVNIDDETRVFYANPNAQYVLDGDIKDILENLELVVTPSTGETHLNRRSLNEAGIEVLSLLDNREKLDEIRASSEFAFLLVLNSLRRLDAAILGKQWIRAEELRRGHELYGKMIGLIGHGRIGKNLEHWCRAFGAGAYWNDPREKNELYQPPVDWLFKNCGVVVICCSFNQTTRGMITGDLVREMRIGGVLINVARGEIVDEESVAEALRERPDIDFWTDVLAGEATGTIHDSPLLGLPNVFVTPHIAGTTVESQEKAAQIALALTEKWYADK